MKKKLFLIPVFCIAVSAAFAQNTSPLPQMDAAIVRLAGDIGRKLNEVKAQKAALAQFSFADYSSPLGAYWTNQLTEELTKLPAKSFSLLSGGLSGADWMISGEIIEMPGVIRVYTRLVRAADRSIAASFHSDFERTEYLAEMLATSGGSRSSSVMRDAWEPDSFENPMSLEIGETEQTSVTNRTFHMDNDEDFFVIQPARDGRIVIETTGNIDTVMKLYNADSGESVAENDDGGSNSNARIRYSVRAGTRYIAEVSAYSDETTGRYGVRAYYNLPVNLDTYESDDNSSSAKLITIGTSQTHNFHDGDDVDWVKFQVTQNGRYVIRARGVDSTSLDTAIELFDSSVESIDDDDDGGEDYDSRLSLYLESGLYYLKVHCLDEDPSDSYTISIEAN